jgi:hypothetical protein
MLDPPAGRSRQSEGSLQAHRGRGGLGGWTPMPRRGYSDSCNTRLRHYAPAAAWTGTRPTLSPLISLVPPGDRRLPERLRPAATTNWAESRRRGDAPQRASEREPPVLKGLLADGPPGSAELAVLRGAGCRCASKLEAVEVGFLPVETFPDLHGCACWRAGASLWKFQLNSGGGD